MDKDPSTGGFRFLDLPAEIRENIYTYVFHPSEARTPRGDDYFTYRYHFGLFCVNRQVFQEARKVFRRLNIFVRVETPWDEAEEHAVIDGHVPLLFGDKLAHNFNDYTLSIEIVAEQLVSYMSDHSSKKFVILLDDLEAFTRMWFYSDLSSGGNLNPNLNVALRIRNPYAGDYDDPLVPKAIQARIFEPFRHVKNLHRFDIIGEHYSSLEKQTREAMAVPYDPPDKCLEAAMKLKDEGNVALSKKDPKAAIELYLRAFEKIHILCVGRRRNIWGDAWFDRQFSDGPFKDQHGQVIRLILRVSLVANVVKAYLDLQEYEEAKFWGMRSIKLVREAVGLNVDEERDEPLLNFPASNQMGKIYYRTGFACKALGQTDQARKLFGVARLYLPHDESVERELSSVTLRLG